MEKAVIVYLVGPSSQHADEFIISLRLLKRHFLDAHPYPVLALTDPSFPDDWKELIASESGVAVQFEAATLGPPEGVLEEYPDFVEAYPLDYLHACRFLAGPIFRHPALESYEYCWRLDSDSYIMSPVTYDVFGTLAAAGAIYGHINEIGELHAPSHRCEGLMEATREYAEQNKITPTFLSGLLSDGRWDRSVLASDCEVTRLDWWREDEPCAFLEHLDRLAGVYERCWSVDAIRTLTLALFLPRERLQLLWDVHYMHQDFEIEFNDEEATSASVGGSGSIPEALGES